MQVETKMGYFITPATIARMSREDQLNMLARKRLQYALFVRKHTQYSDIREMAEARVSVLKKSKNPFVLLF
jgi:hypothetical protein